MISTDSPPTVMPTTEKPSGLDDPLIVFAGGGTGGHLYPALAVSDAIRAKVPQARFTIYGTQRAIDSKILDGRKCDVVRQRLHALSPYPWRWPAIFAALRAAQNACREALSADRPTFVIGTGGLASVPGVEAALQLGIPTAILNPDARPGRANRRLGRRVNVVFAQFEETRQHLCRRSHVEVLGCPVRPEFRSANREEGIKRFGLDAKLRTLLITGASQGARSINDAVLALSEFLSNAHQWQILHLAGNADFERTAKAFNECCIRGVAIAYTEHMAEALAAADLVISRAGASTLAEITAMGRASILMPYPYHKDQHQRANAECLARCGATIVLGDAIEPDLNAPQLRRILETMMFDDAARVRMAEAARKLGRANAASDIANRLLEFEH
ncbi:MAG: UDP-N-acetylglucosamine--N-acetylmuramyl-(pentapeptide) pyrophosphoryl-undecaprenol N-acetylglucosamine transferase [Planctomycetes bacterium]|nr:UDP-N-acetylglucosamine--N-acetylmuramyl-(pentapeptide) pyrophosphoryl-undecaprenol N-acetylglucosamine transferase [Planctomycetota bacterium]MBI3833774.1 UDP-N-acetylglucosamine--N-acetylmuramyl-(pentapeptide) pyrophosphoryl-undecaprenol N-acetylglucosamine transferase [Planctomycetota bacterium]